MSAVPPIGQTQSALTRPIRPAQWPVARWLFHRWRALVMANTAVRREAKALLFAELAEATRHGMPLDLALAMNSQTLREQGRGPDPQTAPGADQRHRGFDLFLGFAMFFVAQLAVVLYLLIAFRVADVGRVARLLGLRLHRYVSQGMTLADAMRRCGADYDPQEVRLAEAGERWGALPQTLRRLSEFQVTEERLTGHGARMLYPLGQAGALVVIGTFIQVVILPKFQDVYTQLGTELPAPTQVLVDLGRAFYDGSGWSIPALFVLAALVFIFRGLMNGNRLSMVVAVLPFLMPLPFVFAWVLENAAGRNLLGVPLNRPTPMLMILSALGFVATLAFTYLLPEVLAGLERIVLRMEQAAGPLLRGLPVVGATARAQAEARWLAALAVGLESGVQAPEAVAAAGRICGGRLKTRSGQAAEAVAGGLSIGQACLATRVLSPEANHRLVMLDTSPDYVEGLKAVADDHAQAAFESLDRCGRVAEVLAVVLMGLAVGLFAIVMYLPLFNIPMIVGWE